jgi:hypothetical protein
MTQAIGPVEKVCAPGRRQWMMVAWVVASVTMVPFAFLGFLYVICSRNQPGDDAPLWLCVYLGLICLPIILIVAFLGLYKLRERLLLGAHGIALWSPRLVKVVRWDDLGTVWRRIRDDETSGSELVVILERSDGTRLAITSFFVDHHVIALRVIEELARRVPLPRSVPAHRDTATDAIKPGEHGLTETGM